jgi:SAM-dependent methyltransferase
MLDLARARINPAKTRLVRSDFLDFEADAPFDFIHASLSLMHTLDAGAFLRKVSSLLKDGGVFFAVDADVSPILVGMMPRAWVNGAKVVIPFEAHAFENVVAEAHQTGLIVAEAGRVPPREEIVARHPKFRRYAGAPCLYYVIGTKGVAP